MSEVRLAYGLWILTFVMSWEKGGCQLIYPFYTWQIWNGLKIEGEPALKGVY